MASEPSAYELLEGIRGRFPLFRSEVLRVSQDPELAADMVLDIRPARKIGRIPTFAKGVSYRPSPMLKERFAFASTMRHGLELWLSPRQMTAWMTKPEIQSAHRACRSHWPESPPGRFEDSRLTLFGITIEVPQNAVYLIWDTVGREPRVWTCTGMDATEYGTLSDFFKFYLPEELGNS